MLLRNWPESRDTDSSTQKALLLCLSKKPRQTELPLFHVSWHGIAASFLTEPATSSSTVPGRKCIQISRSENARGAHSVLNMHFPVAENVEPGHSGTRYQVVLENISDWQHYISMNHISDEDLERYHLEMVTDENELAALEEHYLACPECAKRAEEAADYVDAIRAGITTGNWDLD